MKKIEMIGPWITEHEISVVEDVMRNGWYGDVYGYCEKFQSEFADFHDREFGVMTPNCTTAIHLLLTALDIQEGDEVILPDFTWIAAKRLPKEDSAFGYDFQKFLVDRILTEHEYYWAAPLYSQPGR